jgi:hypothetical protein
MKYKNSTYYSIPQYMYVMYIYSFVYFLDILDSLCDRFLSQNVSAILYLTNAELYGRSTAASQYFLQLAAYLGIPVIAWNADNSGLLRVSPKVFSLHWIGLGKNTAHWVLFLISYVLWCSLDQGVTRIHSSTLKYN